MAQTRKIILDDRLLIESERHPLLNLLNLEAAAAGIVLDATMLLLTQSSQGVLPEILDAEKVRWQTVEIG